MTRADINLHSDIDIIFSTADDGSMSSGGGLPSSRDHVTNADRFLKRHGFPLEHSRVFVTYGKARSYIDIVRVDASNAGQDILADALYTTGENTVITLPVADCVATVVYDPKTHMLGVLHLGRHSSVAGLIEHFIVEVADNLGSDPRDWYVWMSPSLKQQNDRLDYFKPADSEEWRDYVKVREGGVYIDTTGHNKARFIRAGVDERNIVIDPIDTYSDKRYFSHRAVRELDDLSRQGRMMLAVRRNQSS